jgi:hypothetical protein
VNTLSITTLAITTLAILAGLSQIRDTEHHGTHQRKQGRNLSKFPHLDLPNEKLNNIRFD